MLRRLATKAGVNLDTPTAQMIRKATWETTQHVAQSFSQPAGNAVVSEVKRATSTGHPPKAQQ